MEKLGIVTEDFDTVIVTAEEVAAEAVNKGSVHILVELDMCLAGLHNAVLTLQKSCEELELTAIKGD